MLSALSVPPSDAKKAARIDYPAAASEFGPLQRSTYTFTSQQKYEDKIEKVTYGQFASVSALGSTLFRPRSRSPDEETQAGASDASTSELRRSNDKDTDDGSSSKSSIDRPTRVPTLRLTPDDDTTSTLLELGPDGDETKQKVDYDFLNQDGRWHSKPHVFEYNQASSRLLQTAQPHLFGKILQKDRSGPKKCVLNVATMQAIVLRTYQSEIIEAGKEMLDGKMSVMLP